MSFLKKLVPINAKVILEYKPENVDENQLLKGSVKIESEDAFTAKEIRLMVRVVEKYQRPKHKGRGTVTDYHPLLLEEIPIAGAFEAVKGGKLEFSFEVKIPLYTATLSEGSIWTSINAIVNVEGRPDLTMEKTFTM